MKRKPRNVKPKAKRNGADRVRLLLALGAFLAMFAILAVAFTPARYDIQVGQPAPNTIKASKDVNDLITTEKLKADAAATVKSVYYVDEGAADEVRRSIEAYFNEIRSLAVLLDSGEALTDAQLESANERLGEIQLTREQIQTLSDAGEEEMIALGEDTMAFAAELMGGNLSEERLGDAYDKIEDKLSEAGYSEAFTDVAMTVVRACLKANYFYDEDATQAARQAEMDKVATVSRVKGEVIVADGEIVTEAQYAMLNQLGIIKESSVDMWLYVGMGLVTLALIVSTGIYLRLFAPEVYYSNKKLLELCTICLITIGLCIAARQINVYAMPVTLGVLLTALLLGNKLALFINVPLSVIASILGSAAGSTFNMATFSVVISAMVSSTVALLVLRRHRSRLATIRAGFFMAVANVAVTFAVGLIASSSITDSLDTALWTGLNGILAALLSVALMPLFELLFNAITNARLLELSNPNQPLLRRLLMEAPGTYHHSIIVANLAEAAANEVGANGLLARVGSYYHDVGKLKRAMYFKENQLNDNPHDRTDPRISTRIILAHPQDGLQMLKEYRIPEEVQEIVISHHGTTPVVYFYNKSKEQNPDADINDYRYAGPRPHSKEAAVVLLADTVEAAARTLPNPTVESLRALIERLVQGKLTDGQLDECSLTFADISRINDAFVTVLSGAFHERIEYPVIDIPKPGGK